MLKLIKNLISKLHAEALNHEYFFYKKYIEDQEGEKSELNEKTKREERWILMKGRREKIENVTLLA